ncbi:MAG: hypothetical protein IT232_05605 [Flavobacteriales bacterium]|nr:hypothetical protein [Flavobacteriales bacterium]
MLQLKIPSFFKTKKPHQFYYEPRYYNEQKEKMNERYDRISKEIKFEREGKNSGSYQTSLHHNWLSNNRKSKTRSANTRVLLYFIVLIGLVYYFFN